MNNQFTSKYDVAPRISKQTFPVSRLLSSPLPLSITLKFDADQLQNHFSNVTFELFFSIESRIAFRINIRTNLRTSLKAYNCI